MRLLPYYVTGGFLLIVALFMMMVSMAEGSTDVVQQASDIAAVVLFCAIWSIPPFVWLYSWCYPVSYKKSPYQSVFRIIITILGSIPGVTLALEAAELLTQVKALPLAVLMLIPAVGVGVLVIDMVHQSRKGHSWWSKKYRLHAFVLEIISYYVVLMLQMFGMMLPLLTYAALSPLYKILDVIGVI